MRTNKSERRANALLFKDLLERTGSAAIVVERINSSNPHAAHCRFVTTLDNGLQVVIAESVIGIEGCFFELLRAVGFKGRQTFYAEDYFRDWLAKTIGWEIAFNNEHVIMLTRAAGGDTIYTHNRAADIVELFEDVLDNADITVPSPEDDDREPENCARLYGSVYSDLLDSVEGDIISLLEAHNQGTKIVTGVFE